MPTVIPRPSRLLAAGAGMLTVLLVQAPAQAQTAQELQQQIETLNRQLQQLQQQQQQLMQELEAATEDPVIPQEVVQTEKDGVSLTLAGRVNQSVLFASQDDQDQVFVADNDGSGSRFEFLAESDFGEWTSGLEVVVSAEVNSTDEIDFGETEDNADENADLGSFRQAHWFVEHPRYGYFSIGQGDTAAEDTTFVDLSGTSFAGAGADVDDIVGGLTFVDENGAALTEVDDFFDAQDDSRSLRVMYQTPEFFGLSLAVSAANDDQSLEDDDDPAGDGLEPAVGLEYAAVISGYEVEAAASWRRENDVDTMGTAVTTDDVRIDTDVFTGSASVLAPFGLNLTLAGSYADNDDAAGDVDGSTMVFGKIGYRTDVFDFGETRFSIDGYRGTNEPGFAAPDGDLPEATGAGIFAVQAVDELNAEFYVGGRVYSIDDVFRGGAEVDADDLFAVITGARVRF